MSKPILEIQNISKKFRISHQASEYLSLRERMVNALKFEKTGSEDFWALKDVSFEVLPGESIGIIGRNGAGKSTLLKVLSKITPPTKGQIISRGRIASLLEVGTGFHPELTGRENIFFNGSLLGMKRKEIESKFDEIVDFSGVEKFLDTPLKYYSSGMQLRLAFAVAAFLEPEILIIDEVLAVGDAEFQKKCMGKMNEVSRSGRTILFVSHNIQAINSLTSKALWLSGGIALDFDITKNIVAKYINEGHQNSLVYEADSNPNSPKICSVSLDTTFQNNIHKCSEPLNVRIKINTPYPIPHAYLSFQIVDSMERNCVHIWKENFDIKKDGFFDIVCRIPKLKLYMGDYRLKLYFTGPPNGIIYDVVENICPFSVNMLGIQREFEWQPNTCAYLEDALWDFENH